MRRVGPDRSGNDFICELRIDKRDLGEAKVPLAFQFCEHMTSAEQAFGTLFAEGDFRRSFGIDTLPWHQR